MPRRRRTTALDTLGTIPDDLADLISVQDRPSAVRADLGNLPADDTPASSPSDTAQAPAQATPADDPQGTVPADTTDDAADDATPAASLSDPADARPTPETGDLEHPDEELSEPGAGRVDPTAELTQRLEARERELEFLRTGQQTAADQQAIQQTLQATAIGPENVLPFRVTGQDVQVMMTDPDRGAELMNNALTQMGLHLGQVLLQRGMALIEADRRQRTTQEQVRERFWTANQDLVPHQVVLRGYMQDVAAEGGRTQLQILEEAARRTRSYVGLDRADHVDPSGAAAGRQGTGSTRSARPRPAQAERAGGRPNGATTLSPVEREILDLAVL